MPTSTQGAALTEQHRRDQTAIRTAFARDFLTAWSLLNVFQLDATTAAWLALVEQLVTGWRRTSAQTTAAFYEQHRAAELAALHLDRAPALAPRVDDRPDPAALRTSLLVTGPVTIKRLSGQGVPVPEAVPRRPVEQLRGGADPTVEPEETDPAKLAAKVRRGY